MSKDVQETSQSLVKSGLLDSFQILEMIDFIESQFNVVLQENDLNEDHLDSVDSLVSLLERTAKN
ncbi:MAG: hypothetical protein H7A33_07200 [Deltaproteobacteria bacterium]|nr:hypothetical protein [Deltaproteobacteria bacterium]